MLLIGADVNKSTTNNEHTVLSLACAGGHLAVVDLLLKNGAKASHKLKVITSCCLFS
jgi:ankyrin repeat domain-containing protein 17